MNPQVLLEIIKKWEAKSESPDCEDGSPEAVVENAVGRGRRSQLRECANELNMLIKILSH